MWYLLLVLSYYKEHINYYFLRSRFKLKKKNWFFFSNQTALSMMFVENHMQDFFSFIYKYVFASLAFWTIDEWRTWRSTKKSLPKKAILFSQFEGFEFGSLAWKICEMVGKKKGFIFIADIFATVFRIYSKRRIKKAFLWNEKYKIKLWKWIHISTMKEKEEKKEVKFKNSIFFLSDRSAAEYCRWTNCHGMVPILWYKQDDQLFIL